MSNQERYSKLEPLLIKEKISFAVHACNFFSPSNYYKMCSENGLTPDTTTRPLSAFNFLEHLTNNLKCDDAHKRSYRINQLLESLQSSGVLTAMGQSNFIIAPQSYYFLKELSNIEKRGILWLAPALGPTYLKYAYQDVTIHITGTTSNGDTHAGTGILIDEKHILTCAHVINDMELDKIQFAQNIPRDILTTHVHPLIDVGVIVLGNGDATPMKSIAFREPEITGRVHTLGYPRIPLSREPALIMQSGEVVSEEITTIHNEKVFLYSAIARPGNSGGPIISEGGHIVGIVSQDLLYKNSQDAPFYAGVPTSLIQEALNDLNINIQLPIEKYE